MSLYGVEALRTLIGRKITHVSLTEEALTFIDVDGTIIRFGVDADCCSSSYFYDIHGVEKLYGNGPIVSVGAIPLHDPGDQRNGDYIRAYGYKLVSVHKTWGEQTTVFSFRNDSNGYYGGSLRLKSISNAAGHLIDPDGST